MSKELGRYDPETQMFVEAKKEPDLKRLIFLRRLAQDGKFGHYPVGMPVGDAAARALLQYMTPIEAIVREGVPNGKT